MPIGIIGQRDQIAVFVLGDELGGITGELDRSPPLIAIGEGL
ncbi:hypothetical protein [Bradyrhizobium sp. NAS80.1]|nr:hypothetical protein [Bradyrhizobium sp. NAS80.1]